MTYQDTTKKLHSQACKDKKKHYLDPTTGLKVLTEYYLLERGFCCSTGCRHCPYDYEWEEVK